MSIDSPQIVFKFTFYGTPQYRQDLICTLVWTWFSNVLSNDFELKFSNFWSHLYRILLNSQNSSQEIFHKRLPPLIEILDTPMNLSYIDLQPHKLVRLPSTL